MSVMQKLPARPHRCARSWFFQCWIGIKISWRSAVGIIKIGPTIAKLAVENWFPIGIDNLTKPAQTAVVRRLLGFIWNIQMPTKAFFTSQYGEYFWRSSVQFFNAICQRPSGKNTLLIWFGLFIWMIWKDFKTYLKVFPIFLENFWPWKNIVRNTEGRHHSRPGRE